MCSVLLKCARLYVKSIWQGRKDYRWAPGHFTDQPWWEKYVSHIPQKRYWGKKASGMLFLCREDGTLLLLKRSRNVEDPGTWGVPGGAIGEGFSHIEHGEKDPENKTFLESALKETQEELGTIPRVGTLLGTTNFRDGDFTYRTYIYDIPLQEKERFSKQIVLNWENDYWTWFKFEDLPTNLHKGVIFALNQMIKKTDMDEES